MASYQDLFTPIFIIMSLCIFIAGLVGIQVLDRLFAGSKNLNAIRMVCIIVLINVIILLFLIMSFSKVKFNQGDKGPQGNKGVQGYQGDNGGLNTCSVKAKTVEEQKSYEKIIKYIDLKPPLLNTK